MNDGNEQPLVCRLDEAQKEHRRPKAEALFLDKLQGRHETEDGYASEFRSDGDALQRIVDFVDAERKCCPFFRFDVTVEQDHGPISLEIGGSQRVKSYIEENLLAEIDSRAEH